MDMIPKYPNRYSRATNIGKSCLNSDMTIASLYKEYYALSPTKLYSCKTCDETTITLDTAKQTKDHHEVRMLTSLLLLRQSKIWLNLRQNIQKLRQIGMCYKF